MNLTSMQAKQVHNNIYILVQMESLPFTTVWTTAPLISNLCKEALSEIVAIKELL